MRANWDVDRAERQWRHYATHLRHERQVAQQTPAPSGLAAPPSPPAAPPSQPHAGPASPDANSPTSTNPINLDPEFLDELRRSPLSFALGEAGVRDAANAFRDAIEEQHSVVLSIGEVICHLHHHKFDFGLALNAFASIRAARRELHLFYDGLRRPQDGVNDSIHKSKCLQVLTEITRRNDWLSLKFALEKAGWNLIKAIIRWFKKGIPVFDQKDISPSKRRTKGWGLRADRWARPIQPPSAESTVARPGELGEWAADWDDFADAGDSDSPEPLIYGQRWRDDMKEAAKDEKDRSHFVRKLRGRQEGFLLNFDPRPLRAGFIAPSAFRIEWFARGRYWVKIFTKDRFDLKRPERSDESDSTEVSGSESSGPEEIPAVEFDPMDTKHIAALNAWRTSTRWLAGQQTLAEKSQRWTEEELKLLYDLMSEEFDKLKKKYPWIPRTELLPLDLPNDIKKSWEKQFKERFAGRIMPNEQFPRRARKIGGIIQQRTRYPKLAVHFRIRMPQLKEERLTHEEKADIEELERERDFIEAADAQATRDWIDANPENPDFPRGRPPKRRAGKRKRKSDTPPPADGSGPGNGGDGDADADGDGNGDGGAGEGSAAV